MSGESSLLVATTTFFHVDCRSTWSSDGPTGRHSHCVLAGRSREAAATTTTTTTNNTSSLLPASSSPRTLKTMTDVARTYVTNYDNENTTLREPERSAVLLLGPLGILESQSPNEILLLHLHDQLLSYTQITIRSTSTS